MDKNIGMEHTSNPEVLERNRGSQLRNTAFCAFHSFCVTGSHQSLHWYLNGNDDSVYVYQVLYMIPNTFMNTVH